MPRALTPLHSIRDDAKMPTYIARALKKFQHPTPLRAQHSPHTWNKPAYGNKIQYAIQNEHEDKLDQKGKQRIYSIVGTFLYYARAVDPTILPALNDIATVQAAPTMDTIKRTKMLMDYMATYPAATLRFYAGTMQLNVESDAAYLVLPNARSRVAGYFYLHAPKTQGKAYQKTYNAPILVECATLRNVVSSAAEAECGGIFHNCNQAIAIRQALIGMGHPQQKKP